MVPDESLAPLLRGGLPASGGRLRMELATSGVTVGSGRGVTARLRICDRVTGEAMEQPVSLVPAGHGHTVERITGYVQGWLEALPWLLAEAADRAGGWCPPPEALVFPQALRDPRAQTVEDFRQLLTNPRRIREWETAKASDTVRTVSKRVGFGDHAEALADLRRTGIILDSASGCSPNPRTRLGGLPDLPRDAVWPRRYGRPMAFLAQVDLSELVRFDDDSLLPPAGLLQLFADLTGDESWDDPAESGVRVAVQPDIAGLEATSPPAEVDILPVRRTAMSVDPLSVPPLDSPFYSHLLGSAAEVGPHQGHSLLGFLNELHPPLDHDQRPRHQLLGYADPLQDDPWTHCARADGRVPATEWQLLAQLDSEPGATYGDNGIIYIFVPLPALRDADFTPARGVWQMH